MNQTPGELSFIELFAGVGGFRLGLEAAGWEHAWSNQWEPGSKVQYASSCYVNNFGPAGHSNEDIAEVTKRLDEMKTTLPRADLVVGGFPCQDYSVAKSRSAASGIEGKKGVLWWEILKVVGEVKPRALLLENVDRLLASPSGQRGRDFAVMLRSIAEVGYVIEWRVINSADYGYPQRRKRIFIVAYRQGAGAPTQISRDSTINAAFGVESYGQTSEFQLPKDILEVSNTFGLGVRTTPFKKWGMFDGDTVMTADVEPRTEPASHLGSVLLSDENIPDQYWIEDSDVHRWEFLKGAKSLSRTTKEGYNYSYSEGKMAFPDALDRPSRTILTGEGGSTPSRFKHVVRVNKGLRRLVPVELERLNGFPDNWTLDAGHGRTIPDSRRAFLMGNALVIGLVERLGREIYLRLRDAAGS